MGDRYVRVPGSNTPASPYESWSDAANDLATAITAAQAGETIWVEAGTYTISADQDWVLAEGARVIATSDTTNAPPQSVVTGSTYAVMNGTDTTGVDLQLQGDGFWYGLHFKTGGSSTTAHLYLSTDLSSSCSAENCVFELVNTSTSSNIYLGTDNSSPTAKVRTKHCTFKFNSTQQEINLRCFWESLDDVLCDPTGTAPSVLFNVVKAGASLRAVGGDLSAVSGTLFEPSPSSSAFLAWLINCKIHADVTVYAPTVDYGEVYLLDTDSGDNHYKFQHLHYRGTTTADASVYVTSDGASYDGTNRHSWKITTGANTTRALPYFSPWIPVYHAGTSAITSYLEALRSGSTTKYKETEVWVELMSKTNASSTLASYLSNRDDPSVVTASGADNEASSLSASDWTGEDATNNAFMKLQCDASVTPAELGHLMMRVVVGAASVSDLYVDPQVRGLS